MTTRRLGLALLGFSLTVAVVYVPACEYDGAGNKPVEPTYTRHVQPSQTPPSAVAPSLDRPAPTV